jgi:hypothetical protein
LKKIVYYQKTKEMGTKTMTKTFLKKRNVTPAITIKELKKHGLTVDEKQSETILDFLYFLAELSVRQYLDDNY